MFLPQAFSISVPPALADSARGKTFSLRILTDKNQNPFDAAPGEVVGRSLVPLGTRDVEMVLDAPYTR